MENWSSLKREASTLQQYVTNRLNQRSRTDSVVNNKYASVDPESGLLADPDEERLREIEESLNKFENVIQRMSAISAAGGNSTANKAVISSFQLSLNDLRRNWAQQRSAVRARREEEQLFSNRRNDGDQSIEQFMVKEREHWAQSNSLIDDVISRAASTQEMLRFQRTTLSSAAGRLQNFVFKLPVVGDLMHDITRRQNYNQRVLAFFTAFMLILFVWWVVRAR